MSSTTTFALIRHGQTDWNAALRIQGHSDIPLNQIGRGQAADAVGDLADYEWDFVVSSPLSRAAETADLIAHGLGLTVTRRIPEIVERNYGPAEGMSAGPELDALREPGGPTGIGGFMGAESESTVAARGLTALQLLTRDHPGARIIVVSHGTLIRLTLMQALGQPVDTIRNASLNVLAHTSSGWSLDILNGAPVPATDLLPTAS
ncbi:MULTISPECIES: histidine phosphatase family protein [Cryobacterium]|uniref:Histidine phosphatase family protein n=1 Tax=Cryobacterium breve TaxID=1259258 RepID=A0ABY2IZY9_9MICO|nr:MULTISPECIES: histidine phosphatase family protein [Cryobacterium]TFC94780.1 histidine phosphatase family protein [Cryobacterium sp. TmT3-12]TFC96330.1 histidine phosphatase family protein [Cryobacterium breve]